jgi:magnesium-transporting ATPase (P-type)
MQSLALTGVFIVGMNTGKVVSRTEKNLDIMACGWIMSRYTTWVVIAVVACATPLMLQIIYALLGSLPYLLIASVYHTVIDFSFSMIAITIFYFAGFNRNRRPGLKKSITWMWVVSIFVYCEIEGWIKISLPNCGYPSDFIHPASFNWVNGWDDLYIFGPYYQRGILLRILDPVENSMVYYLLSMIGIVFIVLLLIPTMKTIRKLIVTKRSGRVLGC